MTDVLAPTFSGMKGCQYEKELTAFCSLLVREGVRSYLEIGSRYGDSLHAIGMALPRESRIVSVDLPAAAWGKGGSAQHLERAVADLRGNGRDARILWGNSCDAETIARTTSLGPFDACLIDGDHALEGVTRDWINYAPLARIVAFHDVVALKAHDGRSGARVDVPLVWQALSRRYRNEVIAIEKSRMGIGVLWRK